MKLIALPILFSTKPSNLQKPCWDLMNCQKCDRARLPYGALLMERVIRKIEPSTIITSAFGVREGLLFSLLRKKERKRDPLIAACEDLADMRARCPAHGRELCEWTDRLFARKTVRRKRQKKSVVCAMLLVFCQILAGGLILTTAVCKR